MNDHITRYLKHYLRTPEPGYAVMIDGPWGSGKTFFIKEFCREHFDDENQYLYVSLYGAKTTSDIESEIFRQLHPILNSKAARLTGRVLQHALKATLRVELNDALNADVKGELPSLKLFGSSPNNDRVLFFDDLERIEMEPAQALAYINNLVEHGGFRVVIVANEAELPCKDPDYARKREKTIGQTFLLRPNSRQALEGFIAAVTAPVANQALQDSIDNLLQVLEDSGRPNLRLMKYGVLDLARLLVNLDPELMKSDAFVRQFIQDYMIGHLEYKSGDIEADGIEKILSEAYFDRAEKYAAIRKKYPALAGNAPLFDGAIWRKILVDVSASPEEINDAALKSVYFLDRAQPNWVKLWHFRQLEDSEFKSILAEELKQWDKPDGYTELGVVLQLAAMFLNFYRYNLIDKEPKEIVRQAKNAIASLKQRNLLPAASRRPLDLSYGGLGFHVPDSAEVAELVAFAQSQIEAQRAEQLPLMAQALLDCLINDPESFYDQITIGGKGAGIYYCVPIFPHIAVKDFVHALEEVPNSKKSIVSEALSRRYKSTASLPQLQAELQWLEQLSGELEAIVRESEPSIGVTNLKNLLDWSIRPAVGALKDSANPSTENHTEPQ